MAKYKQQKPDKKKQKSSLSKKSTLRPNSSLHIQRLYSKKKPVTKNSTKNESKRMSLKINKKHEESELQGGNSLSTNISKFGFSPVHSKSHNNNKNYKNKNRKYQYNVNTSFDADKLKTQYASFISPMSIKITEKQNRTNGIDDEVYKTF